MEQFKTDISEEGVSDSISNKNNQECILKQNRIFFNLKNNSLIQKILINTLLVRNNCFIDDLARLLQVNEETVYQVWQGKGKLTGKKSHELISLFYLLSDYPISPDMGR